MVEEVKDIHLSLVIPAYNEEPRIKNTLECVYEFLSTQDYSYEVVLCNDGSDDTTGSIAQSFLDKKPNFQLLNLPHRGKGAAVKEGMLVARGQNIFMCDADLAMSLDQINLFLAEMSKGFDIAIGSRELVESRRFEEPRLRYFAGRVFNLFVKFIAIRKYRDTQCGFKCFSSKSARKIFPLLKTSGWAFDVEVLLLADRWGYSVSEIPIDWHHGSDSKVKFGSAVFQMVKDIFIMRIRFLFSIWN